MTTTLAYTKNILGMSGRLEWAIQRLTADVLRTWLSRTVWPKLQLSETFHQELALFASGFLAAVSALPSGNSFWNKDRHYQFDLSTSLGMASFPCLPRILGNCFSTLGKQRYHGRHSLYSTGFFCSHSGLLTHATRDTRSMCQCISMIQRDFLRGRLAFRPLCTRKNSRGQP